MVRSYCVTEKNILNVYQKRKKYYERQMENIGCNVNVLNVEIQNQHLLNVQKTKKPV